MYFVDVFPRSRHHLTGAIRLTKSTRDCHNPHATTVQDIFMLAIYGDTQSFPYKAIIIDGLLHYLKKKMSRKYFFDTKF